MESFRKRGVVLTVKEVEDIIREYVFTKQGWNPQRIDFNIHAVANPNHSDMAYRVLHYDYILKSVTATEESNESPTIQK